MRNYYEVLEVPVTASREDLKRSYLNLVRAHHPDKKSDPCPVHFLLIDEAWKVLSDQELRKKYDSELKAAESQYLHPVQTELRLSETRYDRERKQYESLCRCGGIYAIEKGEVCVGELYSIDCDSCSLSIVVDCDVKNVDQGAS